MPGAGRMCAPRRSLGWQLDRCLRDFRACRNGAGTAAGQRLIDRGKLLFAPYRADLRAVYIAGVSSVADPEQVTAAFLLGVQPPIVIGHRIMAECVQLIGQNAVSKKAVIGGAHKQSVARHSLKIVQSIILNGGDRYAVSHIPTEPLHDPSRCILIFRLGCPCFTSAENKEYAGSAEQRQNTVQHNAFFHRYSSCAARKAGRFRIRFSGKRSLQYQTGVHGAEHTTLYTFEFQRQLPAGIVPAAFLQGYFLHAFPAAALHSSRES